MPSQGAPRHRWGWGRISGPLSSGSWPPVGVAGKGGAPKVGDGSEPVIGDFQKDIPSQPSFCRFAYVFLDKLPFSG